MARRKKKNGWALAKSKIRYFVRAHKNEPLNPRRWVFVIGCYNSGTTLLSTVLNSHNRLVSLPREGVELTDVLPRPEQFGWPRMWTKCYPRMLIKDIAPERRSDRIKRHWAHHIRENVEQKVVVEKSIANLTRLEFLQAHFQPASFIYIVRNGFAVAEGIQRRTEPRRWGREEFGDAYPIELCARQWVAADECYQAQKDSLENVLEITYEQFTEDTMNTLGRITSFLSLESFPENTMDENWVVHRQKNSIINMNPPSIDRLTKADKDAILNVASDTLKAYSYISG